MTPAEKRALEKLKKAALSLDAPLPKHADGFLEVMGRRSDLHDAALAYARAVQAAAKKGKR